MSFARQYSASRAETVNESPVRAHVRFMRLYSFLSSRSEMDVALVVCPKSAMMSGENMPYEAELGAALCQSVLAFGRGTIRIKSHKEGSESSEERSAGFRLAALFVIKHGGKPAGGQRLLRKEHFETSF